MTPYFLVSAACCGLLAWRAYVINAKLAAAVCAAVGLLGLVGALHFA